VSLSDVSGSYQRLRKLRYVEGSRNVQERAWSMKYCWAGREGSSGAVIGQADA
jgi:hypothetical protein